MVLRSASDTIFITGVVGEEKVRSVELLGADSALSFERSNRGIESSPARKSAWKLRLSLPNTFHFGKIATSVDASNRLKTGYWRGF